MQRKRRKKVIDARALRVHAHVASASNNLDKDVPDPDTAEWWLRFRQDADPVEDAIIDEFWHSLLPNPEPDLREVWMERYGSAVSELLKPDERGEVWGEVFGSGVEVGDPRDSAVQTLVFQVWLDVHKWYKQPKPDVIAAAIGLAIAYATHAGSVKHPRDIAKEVHVRPQTLFKIRKVALAKIEEFGLSEGLLKAVSKQYVNGTEGECY